MKHISTYSQVINESLGKGSVILVNGPKENGGRKLYATHIEGYAEVRPGVIMFFLGEEFYRIVRGENGLKKLRVGFSNNDLMRKNIGFNVGMYGRPSVMRNNNKTPYHWKTTKYTNIDDALRAVDQDILRDPEYLLESESNIQSMYYEFYQEIVQDILDTLFFGEKKLNLIEFEYPSNVINDYLSAVEEEHGTDEVSWDASITAMLSGEKYSKYKEALDLGNTVDISIEFNSDVTYTSWYDSGDYYNAPEGDTEINDISTVVGQIWVDGDDASFSSETDVKVDTVNQVIKHMDDEDISRRIMPNLSNQLLLKIKK